MLNKVMLIGNVGQDPEVKYGTEGNAITSFRLATEAVWKSKDGEKMKKTTWHKVVAFRKLAETCRDHVSKGKKLYVEGEIEVNNYETKEGQKRKDVYIRANVIKFLDSRRKQVENGERYEEDPDNIPF